MGNRQFLWGFPSISPVMIMSKMHSKGSRFLEKIFDKIMEGLF